MTYERAINGSLGIGAVVALAWACAGGETPQRTPELDRAIADGYAGSSIIPSGGSGSGGGNGGAGPSGGDGGADPGGGGSAGGNNQTGSGGSGGTPDGDFCNAPEVVFFDKCGGETSFCHGDRSGNGAFAENPAAAAAVLNQASANNPTCGLLIDSDNINDSLILTKVGEDTYDPDCGNRMPIDDPNPLPEEDVECIRSWLSQFQE